LYGKKLMLLEKNKTLIQTLTKNRNGKGIAINYGIKDYVKLYKEKDYVKCKIGSFQCVYCTHGGCSKNYVDEK